MYNEALLQSRDPMTIQIHGGPKNTGETGTSCLRFLQENTKEDALTFTPLTSALSPFYLFYHKAFLPSFFSDHMLLNSEGQYFIYLCAHVGISATFAQHWHWMWQSTYYGILRWKSSIHFCTSNCFPRLYCSCFYHSDLHIPLIKAKKHEKKSKVQCT